MAGATEASARVEPSRARSAAKPPRRRPSSRSRAPWRALALAAAFSCSCAWRPFFCPLDLEVQETKERGHVQRFCARSGGQTPLAEGPFQELYSDGKVRCEGRMRNGTKTGDWVCRHPNGRTMSRTRYVDGARDGSGRIYAPSGAIEARNEWRAGFLHGDQRSYREDGSLESIQEFQNGRPHGWLKAYEPDGTWTFRARYVDGVRSGCPETRPRADAAWSPSCDEK